MILLYCTLEWNEMNDLTWFYDTPLWITEMWKVFQNVQDMMCEKFVRHFSVLPNIYNEIIKIAPTFCQTWGPADFENLPDIAKICRTMSGWPIIFHITGISIKSEGSNGHTWTFWAGLTHIYLIHIVLKLLPRVNFHPGYGPEIYTYISR